MFFGPVPPCRLNFRIARWLARSVGRFFFWCRPAPFHAPSEAAHLLLLDNGQNVLFRRRDVAKRSNDLSVTPRRVSAGG